MLIPSERNFRTPGLLKMSFGTQLRYKAVLLLTSLAIVHCNTCYETEVCTPAKMCESIVKYLHYSSKPLTEDVKKYIRGIACGSEQVCCPLTDGSNGGTKETKLPSINRGGLQSSNQRGAQGGNSGGHQGGNQGGLQSGNLGGYQGGNRGILQSDNQRDAQGSLQGGNQRGVQGGNPGGHQGGNQGGLQSGNRGVYQGGNRGVVQGGNQRDAQGVNRGGLQGGNQRGAQGGNHGSFREPTDGVNLPELGQDYSASSADPGMNHRLSSGASKVALGEFPWIALIIYNTGDRLRYHCGGSIISDRYILTSSHCLQNQGSSILAGVRVGEHDISQQMDCEASGPGGRQVCSPDIQDFTIEEAIPHPDYAVIGGQIQNDIALIRIKGAIDFAKGKLSPVNLPRGPQLQKVSLDSVSAVMAGWGITAGEPQSPQMLKTTLIIIPNSECAEIYKNTFDLRSQLCAGRAEGYCSGDPGGPLMVSVSTRDKSGLQKASLVQFGIVSKGPESCSAARKFTRITHYLKWIRDNMKV